MKWSVKWRDRQKKELEIPNRMMESKPTSAICPTDISGVRSCPGRNILSFNAWSKSEAEIYNPKMSVEKILFKTPASRTGLPPFTWSQQVCLLSFLSPCWVRWVLEILLKGTAGVGFIKLKKGKDGCYTISLEYFSVLVLFFSLV